MLQMPNSLHGLNVSEAVALWGEPNYPVGWYLAKKGFGSNIRLKHNQ
jgi:hypothetical protein